MIESLDAAESPTTAMTSDDWRRRLSERRANGPADALAAVDEALAAFPLDAGFHSFRATQLYLMSRLDEAEAAFKRALARESSAATMLKLARVHVAQGRRREALELAGQALADGQYRARGLSRASVLYAALGDHQSAVELLTEAIATSPAQDLKAARERALACLAEDAEAGVHPPHKRLFGEALEHLRRGDPAAAEPLFAELTQCCAAYAPAWIGLRGALVAQGRTAEAQAVRSAWAAAAPSAASVIDAGMDRTLGGRGFLFDPRDRFPFRPMAKVLRRTDSPEDLKASDDVYFVIDPGGTPVEYDPVVSLDGRGHDRFRVRYRTAPKHVAALKGAMIVGDGVVITAHGEIIQDLCPTKPSKYGARREGACLAFEPGRFGDGVRAIRCFDTPAFLMTGPTDTAFGDWIINFGSRPALLEAAGLDCPVVVRSTLPAKSLDMLQALGVSRDRILRHDPETISLFPKLYVPSWPSGNKFQPMAGVFDVYRRAALPPTPGARPLLYLTRRGSSKRRMVNEDEVCALFARRGFQIVDPGGLGFEEVRRLFANPACVAGGFGSAFHNLAFCGGRPINLVLLPTHTELHLDEVAIWHGDHGLRFGYVWGESLPDPRFGADRRQAPWQAPLEEVERAIDQILDLIAQEDDEGRRRDS